MQARRKVIFLIEQMANPKPFIEQVSKVFGDRVDVKTVYAKDGVLPEVKPWGEHSSEVSHILTLWGSLKNIQALYQHAPNVKWVHAMSAGVDKLIGSELEAMNFTLTNSKGSFSESLGEYVAFQMLWFAKKGLHYLKAKERGEWAPEVCTKLTGKTLGIIGYGDIGGQCALRAKYGFNMRVLGLKNDPTKCEERYRNAADEIVGFDQIDKVLSESDFVLSSLPLVPATTGFFDYSHFKKMKASAIFMNVGRGRNVVERDLIQALKEGVIAGAYLDVFETEPLPKDSELWAMDNVFLVPHTSDNTDDIMDTIIEVYAEHLDLFLADKPLKNVIDKTKGY